MAEHILECTALGVQAGFHAIGDAATDQVVAAMRLAAERDPRVLTAGHRVEHAELLSDPAAFAEVGLTASVQPAFDATWGGPDGMYAQRLGGDRAARLNPLAALAAAGVPLALGSDSPVTPVGPWAAVRAASRPAVRRARAQPAGRAHRALPRRLAGGRRGRATGTACWPPATRPATRCSRPASCESRPERVEHCRAACARCRPGVVLYDSGELP